MSETDTAGNGIVVPISASIQGLLAGMKTAAGATHEATAAMTESFEEMESGIKSAMAPLLGFVAIFEGFHILKEALETVTETAVQLEILGQKTGISVTELSRLKYAADLSHVSMEQFAIGMQRLSRGMEGVAKGVGPAADAFKALNLRATETNGSLRPLEQVFLDIADRFHQMEDGATKTALAIDIFGRSGASLIPMLNLGREGIDELERAADKLGVTLTKDNMAAIAEYVSSLKQLKAEWGALVRELVVDALPVLDALARSLMGDIEIIKGFAWAVRVAMDIVELHWRRAYTSAQEAAKAFELAWDAYAGKNRPKIPEASGGILDPDLKPKPKNDILKQFQFELDKIKLEHASDLDGMIQRELDFWKEKLTLVKEGSAEYMEIYGKITDLTIELERKKADAVKEAAREAKRVAKELAEEQKRILKQTADQWIAVFDAIPGAFKDTFNSMKQTGGTFAEFMRQSFQRITLDFIAAEAKMLAAHAAAWLARKGITAQGVVTTVALEAWGAIKVIAMKAAEAAAAAWSAIAGIPYVGPFLAPIAAAATLAGVLALAGGISSAAGGYDIPAGVNPLVQTHAREMILPAKYADVIRGMANGGGASGGDTHHWHIHTVDAVGVRQFMMKHKDSIAAAGNAAAANGKGFRNQPGRRA